MFWAGWGCEGGMAVEGVSLVECGGSESEGCGGTYVRWRVCRVYSLGLVRLRLVVTGQRRHLLAARGPSFCARPPPPSIHRLPPAAANPSFRHLHPHPHPASPHFHPASPHSHPASPHSHSHPPPPSESAVHSPNPHPHYSPPLAII